MNTIFLFNETTGSLTPISMLDIKEGDVIKIIGTSIGTYKVCLEKNKKTGGEIMKMLIPS